MAPYAATVQACQAMASTVAGQRRILKRHGSVVDYIKRAVETGVYRTLDELAIVRRERATNGTDDLRVIMSRFRQDIVRGSFVHDYPVEYLILEQHPPIPDPPRTPVKLLKQLAAPPNPVERLTKQYLHRQEQQQQQQSTTKQRGTSRSNDNGTSPNTTSTTGTEEYYRRLLGVQAAASASGALSSHGSSLRHQPASVQRAYAAAMTHYHVQRTEGLTDAEAVRRVDDLLARHSATDETTSHARTRTAQEHRATMTMTTTTSTSVHAQRMAPPRDTERPHSRGGPANSGADYPFLPRGSSSLKDELHQYQGHATDTGGTSGSSSSSSSSSTWDSIFSREPRTVQGMMRWSERLAAVPYLEWTVGASTALDHWIARQVLQVSEETWQSTLQGDDPDLLAIGRDIVACREALFPETMMGVENDERLVEAKHMTAEAIEKDGVEEMQETETKSIEELLRKLGGLRGPDANSTSSSSTSKSISDDWGFLAQAEQDADDEQHSNLDAKVDKLIQELQSWRRRNMETPYESWSRTDQDRFTSWMKGYVHTVSSGAERNRRVDYNSTRLALLGQPPVTGDESDAFWSQLTDQSTATALLEAMVHDGPPPGATVLQSAFWDLPRAHQLRCLLNLGALRPLLDEYTKESDRLRFLQRHGDTILAGVPLEHLVADPQGPVRTVDLKPDVILALGIPDGARFRLELIPYKSLAATTTTTGTRTSSPTAAMETSRALFMAWNEHKAGRARYEEKMFQTGRLGLRYRDKIVDPDAKQ